MLLQIAQNLSRLWPQPRAAARQHDAAAVADTADGADTDADDGVAERSWHASSWALTRGLEVSEAPIDAEAASMFADTVAAFHAAELKQPRAA